MTVPPQLPPSRQAEFAMLSLCAAMLPFLGAFLLKSLRVTDLILTYFLNSEDTSNRISPNRVCSFISIVGHLPKFDIPPEKPLPFLTKVSSVPLYFASFLNVAVTVDSFAIDSVKKITREIIKNRGKNEIKTTTQLNEIIHPLIPNRISNKILSRVYQAIRIEVNNELDAIRSLLKQTVELLKIGGRISLISYHSLEDRIVKRFFKTGKFQGEIEKDIYGNYSLPYKIIGKLIVPNQTEINRNVRARSAKLRIAERV